MMETTITDFRTSFYIRAIQRLTFHIPHVCILGANQCGKLRRTAFKHFKLFQDDLCCFDYFERLVASFARQIKPEYNSGNMSVSIEGISLEHFSALPKSDKHLKNHHVNGTQCLPFIII